MYCKYVCMYVCMYLCMYVLIVIICVCICIYIYSDIWIIYPAPIFEHPIVALTISNRIFPVRSCRKPGHRCHSHNGQPHCLLEIWNVPGQISGWWLEKSSKKYESELGWWFPIPNILKNKTYKTCSKPPTSSMSFAGPVWTKKNPPRT